MIRPVTPGDAGDIARLYKHYVAQESFGTAQTSPETSGTTDGRTGP